MKVIIQRPRESYRTSYSSFVDCVFEVNCQTSRAGASGWAILDSIEATDLVPQVHMPYLHRGFFDSHLHATWLGLYSAGVDLKELRSVDDVLKQITAKIRTGGPLIRGYGWDEANLGISWGALEEIFLKRLPNDLPVILYRVCGHAALINRKLAEFLGAPELPTLVRDEHLPEINAKLPPTSQSDSEAAFLRAQEQLLQKGISAIGDMSLDDLACTALKAVANSGKLKMDVCGVIDHHRATAHENAGPFSVHNQVSIGPHDRAATFSVRHWKKFLDGSLGARTAWLSQSYADFDGFGQPMHETSVLINEARAALKKGFHLSFHAIGDAAVDQVLALGVALERPMKLNAPRIRHRIEHAQVIREEQLSRLAAQDVWVICAQPHHRIADQHFGASRLGRERLYKEAYRAHGFWQHQIPLTLGSDAPIDSFDPAQVLRAVCHHENTKESLSISEAMWAYTTGGRLSLGLDPGKLGPGSTVFLSQGIGA